MHVYIYIYWWYTEQSMHELARNHELFQNVCRRPFWMTKNHFHLHFSPFQINTQLFFLHKMGCHFGWPKITFNRISDQYTILLVLIFFKFCSQNFGWPKITFYRISRHFRSIRNFLFFGNFSQNGGRRPFWMTKNNFLSHFSPFQINTQLSFFWKFLAKWQSAAIFDDRKSLSIAYLAISDQYATLFFWGKFLTNWPPAAILDDRKSLSIAFLAISDQYTTLIFLENILSKWLPAAIFDDRKSLSIAFLAISDQYATFIFWKFFIKWPPVAILDDRKSLFSQKGRWIAFLATSDQYATFFFSFWIPIFAKVDRDLPL